MVQLLIVVGSSIFVLLGAGHGVLTIRDLSNPRSFTPRDPELRAAMQQSTIAFHPKINLWQAWLGFNLIPPLRLLTSKFIYTTSLLINCSGGEGWAHEWLKNLKGIAARIELTTSGLEPRWTTKWRKGLLKRREREQSVKLTLNTSMNFSMFCG